MNALTVIPEDRDPLLVDAMESGATARPGARVALIDRDLRFSIDGLGAYFFSQWESRLYDLMVVAASVEYCDITTHRPAHGWSRRFDLQIAVHEPDIWSAPEVRGTLEDAISFLTGDIWDLHFIARRQAAQKIESSGLSLATSARIIMPFSDGLDSRAVAALVTDQERGVLRVRLGREGRDQRQPGRRTEAFMAVPYEVRVEKGQRRESTARSRGFKFAVITGVAAHLASIKTIVVTESGQGALGPALVVTGHGYPDYRVHPSFSRKIERLFESLMGTAPEYIFPRLWSTKAETLKLSSQLKTAPRLLDTRSCWQQSRQVGVNGRRRQCGICAACMLRRQSMYVAGLIESRDTYVWEDLSAPTFRDGAVKGFDRITGALEEYAIAGVLHLDHLAALSDSPLHAGSIKRNARQIAAAMREEPAIVQTRIRGLLRRHRLEWQAFLASLGPNSFVVKWASITA